MTVKLEATITRKQHSTLSRYGYCGLVLVTSLAVASSRMLSAYPSGHA